MAQGDGCLGGSSPPSPILSDSDLLRFTLDSGGTRIILIIGSTLMFFGGIKEALGNWKMEGRIQFAVILSQKVVSNFPK